MPPSIVPAGPFNGFYLPPCNPADNRAPAAAPETGCAKAVLCVAKPSVPAETLQEAMDYACGEDETDCEEIMPHGSCFYPDNVYASYALNNYWQKTKRNGGTCNFGDTAMIINADPTPLQGNGVLNSYSHTVAIQENWNIIIKQLVPGSRVSREHQNQVDNFLQPSSVGSLCVPQFLIPAVDMIRILNKA
ncbi:hypothetical protein DITRI_Ditri16bG0044100 [Diplodiscus trichospermus]